VIFGLVLVGIGFLCLTGHYIDSDWKLRKKFLLLPLCPLHTLRKILPHLYIG
jgi:hypothetical protein